MRRNEERKPKDCPKGKEKKESISLKRQREEREEKNKRTTRRRRKEGKRSNSGVAEPPLLERDQGRRWSPEFGHCRSG